MLAIPKYCRCEVCALMAAWIEVYQTELLVSHIASLIFFAVSPFRSCLTSFKHDASPFHRTAQRSPSHSCQILLALDMIATQRKHLQIFHLFSIYLLSANRILSLPVLHCFTAYICKFTHPHPAPDISTKSLPRYDPTVSNWPFLHQRINSTHVVGSSMFKSPCLLLQW